MLLSRLGPMLSYNNDNDKVKILRISRINFNFHLNLTCTIAFVANGLHILIFISLKVRSIAVNTASTDLQINKKWKNQLENIKKKNILININLTLAKYCDMKSMDVDVCLNC